jgi:hypothetical protein
LPTKLSSADLKDAAKLLRNSVKIDRIDIDEINEAKNEGRA